MIPTAGFLDEAIAGQAIPGMHVGLVVSNQPPSRDIGEHQRTRTVADEVAAGRQKILDHFGDKGRCHVVVGADAGDGVADGSGRVKGQHPSIERRALAGGPGIEFIVAGRVDDADHRFVVMQNGDRDAPVRHAVDERAGAVDRIDYPGIAGIATGKTVFLTQKSVVRMDFRDASANEVLHLAIGNGNNVLRVALGFNHQRFASVVIVERDGACFLGDGLCQGKTDVEPGDLRCHEVGPFAICLRLSR